VRSGPGRYLHLGPVPQPATRLEACSSRFLICVRLLLLLLLWLWFSAPPEGGAIREGLCDVLLSL
jgi:hypothetical protein